MAASCGLKARPFDPAQRAAEKQASRDTDARAVAERQVTEEQLRRDNNMFEGVARIELGAPQRGS
jgi:hypothetical protein